MGHSASTDWAGRDASASEQLNLCLPFWALRLQESAGVTAATTAHRRSLTLGWTRMVLGDIRGHLLRSVVVALCSSSAVHLHRDLFLRHHPTGAASPPQGLPQILANPPLAAIAAPWWAAPPATQLPARCKLAVWEEFAPRCDRAARDPERTAYLFVYRGRSLLFLRFCARRRHRLPPSLWLWLWLYYRPSPVPPLYLTGSFGPVPPGGG